MRVLMFATTYPMPSAQTRPSFIRSFVESLQDRACDVKLVLPSHPFVGRDYPTEVPGLCWFRYGPAFAEQLTYGDGIMANLRRKPWLYFILPVFLCAMSWRCVREIRSGGWDVIHAHWWFPCGYALLLAKWITRSRVPLLITCHGGDFYALSGRFWDPLKTYILSSAQRVAAVSSSMRKDMLALGLPEEHCVLGPMGVDLTGRFVLPREGLEPLWDVLFVGRFVEKKGLGVLLEALELLDRSGVSLKVALVGDGPLKNEVKARVRSFQRCYIKLLGSLENSALPPLYQRSRIFVFPSLTAPDGDQEGLGLVNVEAIGCGCLPVSSDIPAVWDIFGEQHGEFLFPQRDALALSNLLLKRLGEYHSDAAKRSLRELVSKKFAWQAVAENYEAIYRDIAHA